MSAEIATYLQELQWLLDQIAHTLRSYPSGKLDWRPISAAANSASAIASHVVSSTRVYVLGFGCGQAVTRERQAEFAAAGRDRQELMSEIHALSTEISAALTALPPAALDQRLLPPRELWGPTSDPREISAREAIVESIRHAALHLGELRLTRDLAEQADI
jgi:DinB superfamily